ncbi:MAG: Flp pilus assembly complex ATPase component TadA [Planctomycetes bacterium]|nr:Flp pilus assembly complex ATPase component TadA [Planctomycetota bacterium]
MTTVAQAGSESIAAPVVPTGGQAARPARLGEQLIDAGLLTQEQLEAALGQQQGKNLRLGELLEKMGFVNDEAVLPFVSRNLGVPTVRLRDGLLDPRYVELIPRATAEAMHAVAMFKVRDTLTVAMADPQNLRGIDELERITGSRVRPVLASRTAIKNILPRCYEDDFQVDAVTADMEMDSVEVHTETIDMDFKDVQALADGSPVVNLVSWVIMQALRQGASDIHIEPGNHHSMVRFRVDGQLREVLKPRRDFHPAIVSRVKVMSRMDIAEHRVPQDGRVHVLVQGHEIDLRVSTLPTVLGEKVVLRVLDRRNITFDLDKLGVPESQLDELKQLLNRPYGLLLVTGPTGSGKTTTLYSAIELIKSVHRNIVTVEDPVEYQLELINQVQTGGSKAMTFANALRAILRQDPDVVMVGEIRDGETAEVAIQAALTGHLVLSTLHTNDSASAVTRLLDMGVASYKIAAALVGVIAQRLVRTICQNCRTQYYPPAEYLEMLHYEGDKRRQFVRGEGCEQCFDTGHRGRRGVYEVLVATRELRELINDGADLEAIRKCHAQQGGTFLLQEGIRVAEQGLTSLEEVTRVAFFE